MARMSMLRLGGESVRALKIAPMVLPSKFILPSPTLLGEVGRLVVVLPPFPIPYAPLPLRLSSLRGLSRDRPPVEAS
eukprot:1760108-Pyramimonas_sp.AAC.1